MSARGASMEIKGILSDIDWDEGFSIPVANADNKRLEDEIQQLKLLILQKHSEERRLTETKAATTEHFKNVTQELQNTLALLNARKKETETETHLTLIAEREEGRLKQEIKKLEMDYDELKSKKNFHENMIYKQTQTLEDIKSQMNWDQQALEAWLEESARKDEDAMMLAKYSATDDSKVKELSLRLEKLMAEKLTKEKALDGIVTETMAAQIELDKTAEDFRKAHMDRQNLIHQWEMTIERMQTRDNEMDHLADQLARFRIEVQQCEEALQDKNNFLQQARDNNEEEEKKIQATERQSAKLHLEYREAESNRLQFQSELEALKRTVDRTAMDLEICRSSVNHLTKDVAAKQNKLAEVKEMRSLLVKKLHETLASTLTAEQRAAEMEKFLAKEKKLQADIEAKMKEIRDVRLRKNEQLAELEKNEKILEAELQGNTACIRSLNSKLAKMDHDSLKQLEILYNQDFEIQQLERRISRMQGERSNEEQVALEQKIKYLQGEIDFKGSTVNKLVTQLKKLQDDIRRTATDQEKGKTIKDTLTKKIEELDLYIDSTERESRAKIKLKQDSMVDANLLKLEIKRLRDILNDRSDGVVSHEKRKVQLENAIKERQTEIDIHRSMLRAQLKAGDDERSQIRAEVYDRVSKIDKLRKRYEILMVSMAPPEGLEEHSQAYYVIKAAQEKEDIQRQGDDLDAKIRKAEKEIRALENTVRLLNSRNETYRKSFQKLTETSDEMEDKEKLEEQLRAVTDKYKYKRRMLTEVEEDIKALQNSLQNLDTEENMATELYAEKTNKIVQLNKDLDDQHVKLERVAKQITRCKKDIRSAKGMKTEHPNEKDVQLRGWRDLNKVIVRHLTDAVEQQPELRDPLITVLSESELPLPAQLQGAGSRLIGSASDSDRSRSSSIRSLMKSSSPGLESPLGSPLGGSRSSLQSSGSQR